MDNEGRGYHCTCENDESKEKKKMNENNKMEWNESIEMEMEKSVIELVERKNGMGINGIE